MIHDEPNPEIVGEIKALVPPLTSSEKKLSQEERERYALENKGIEQDQDERKIYANRVFILCCCWVCAVYILIMFVGFGAGQRFHFVLTERVILAAIGSTTANIVGVFLIVVRYIFPKT